MPNSAKIREFTEDDAIAFSWEKADLDYLLKPHQDRIEKAFIDSNQRLFVEEIGRQVGKTFWNCKKAVEVGLGIPNARIKYASAFLTSLEEYVIPNLRTVLAGCPPHKRPKLLDSKKKVIFKNGSEIKLIGLDKQPDAGRGPYCDLYIIDEAGFVKSLETIIDSVILPMFNTRPWGRIILSSSSPESPAHPFIQFADKYALPEFNSYIMMTIEDNKELSPERIESIKAEYTSHTAMRRELYCERIVEATKAIIPEWGQRKGIEIEPDEFRPFYHNYVFMDIGVKKDFTAILFGYYDFVRAKLVIEDEFHMNGPDMTTERLQAAIKAKEEELWKNWRVYRRIADNSHPLLLQDLNSTYGLHFYATNKSSLQSMVNKVRIWVPQEKIEIHSRCKYLLGSLKSGIWDKLRKEFEHSIAYGHFDHLAAFIYGVRNTDVITNPIPAHYGFNLASTNVIVIPGEKKTILKRFGE